MKNLLIWACLSQTAVAGKLPALEWTATDFSFTETGEISRQPSGGQIDVSEGGTEIILSAAPKIQLTDNFVELDFGTTKISGTYHWISSESNPIETVRRGILDNTSGLEIPSGYLGPHPSGNWDHLGQPQITQWIELGNSSTIRVWQTVPEPRIGFLSLLMVLVFFRTSSAQNLYDMNRSRSGMINRAAANGIWSALNPPPDAGMPPKKTPSILADGVHNDRYGLLAITTGKNLILGKGVTADWYLDTTVAVLTIRAPGPLLLDKPLKLPDRFEGRRLILDIPRVVVVRPGSGPSIR